MKRVIAPVLLLLIAAAFLWRVFLLGEAPWFGDVIAQFMPWKIFARGELLAGRIPLWDPYHFSGSPFLANMQSAVLYPVDLLLLPFSVERAFGLSLWIHTVLAGLFAYLFVRDFGVSRPGSLFAGLAFMFSGFFMIHIFAGNTLTAYAAAWSPLILLLGKRIGESVRDRRETGAILPLLAWGGPAAALQILVGHPQIAFYSFFFAAVLAILIAALGGSRGTIRRRMGRGGKALAAAIVVLAFGAGIAAAQILPTAEFALHSSREQALSIEEAGQFTFSPDRLIEFLVPEFFGTRFRDAAGRIENTFWAPVWRAALVEREWVVNWKNWSSVYLGGFAFVLALFGMFHRGEEGDPFRRLRIPLGLFLVLALFLSFGPHTPVFKAFFLLPGFKHFRAPSKYTPYMILALCAFAGAGFDRAVNEAKSTGTRWRFARYWAVAGGIVLALALGSLVVRHGLPVLKNGRLMGDWTAAVSLRAFLFIAAGGLVLFGLRRRFFDASAAVAVLIILQAAEMTWLGNKYLTLGIPEWRGTFAVREEAGKLGVDFDEPSRFIITPDLGAPETWSMAGMEAVSGYDPMQLADYVRYIAKAEGWESAGFVDTIVATNYDAPEYDLLNVRYVLSSDADVLAEDKNLALLGAVPGLAAAERDPYPRAFWAPRSAVAETDGAYSLQGVSKAAADEHRAEYHRPSPGRIEVEFDAPEAGYLFLSEVYYPGWSAEEVGGWEEEPETGPLPIYKVNGLFRLVPVEAGEHRIRLAYRPFSFALGAGLSVAAAGIWVVLFLLWLAGGRVERRHGGNE